MILSVTPREDWMITSPKIVCVVVGGFVLVVAYIVNKNKIL